jgi:hypothetical protein
VVQVQEFADSVADSITEALAGSPLFDQDASDEAGAELETTWATGEGGFAVA